MQMTKVAILPEPLKDGVLRYRAIAGDHQSVGATAGQALDALAAQLPESQSNLLVVVQSLAPDEYFTADQRKRLEALMTRWRAARDSGSSLSDSDQQELDVLVAQETEAAGKRAARMRTELAP
jgi:hypothetical protein